MLAPRELQTRCGCSSRNHAHAPTIQLINRRACSSHKTGTRGQLKICICPLKPGKIIVLTGIPCNGCGASVWSNQAQQSCLRRLPTLFISAHACKRLYDGNIDPDFATSLHCKGSNKKTSRSVEVALNTVTKLISGQTTNKAAESTR